MHADFQELLSLRDGESVRADVEQHVGTCADCRHELARLKRLESKLRQLPQLVPPPRTWPAIREELASLQNRRQGSSWLSLSAAAALLVVVALAFLWPMHRDRGGLVANSTVARSDDDSEDGDMIGLLVTRSQQLEKLLQRLPERPTVERASTSATIDELQFRIQVLDLQLSTVAKSDLDRERAQRLWNTRVQLLSSLAYVRYAEAVRDGDESVNPPASGVI